MKKNCLNCKKVFEKSKFESKKYWKIKKFCSNKCAKLFHFKKNNAWNKGKKINCGKENPFFKGGRYVSKAGYVMILAEGKGKYQYEHRIIIEKLLGRKLKRAEVVHHKNGIKTDNRIKNLELLIKNDHDSKETKKRWRENPKSFNNYRLKD